MELPWWLIYVVLILLTFFATAWAAAAIDPFSAGLVASGFFILGATWAATYMRYNR